MEIQINDKYSAKSKAAYLQVSQYINCLQVLLSIPILVITIQSLNSDFSISLLIIAILAGITVFISILSFISQMGILSEKHLLNNQSEKNFFSKLIFIIQTVLVISFMIFLIDMMMLKNSFFQKSQIQESLGGTAFSINWTFTQSIEILSITLVILLLSINSFLQYIVFVNINTIRNAILIYNLLFALASIITLFFLKYLDEYYTSSHLKHFQNSWVLQIVKIFSYISLGLSFLCIFILSIKQKIPSFVYGGTLFFFLFFVICFAGLIFRDASSIRSYYMNNCGSEIRLAHKNFLETTGCPYKYQKIQIAEQEVYSMQCDAEKMGVVWEANSNNIVNEQLACLNYDCCDNLADAYSIPFYNIALSWIAQALFGFCMVWGFFYLSRRKQTEQETDNTLVWMTGVLVFAIIIAGVIILNVKNFKPEAISYINVQKMHKNINEKIEINKNPKKFPQQFAPACENIFVHDTHHKWREIQNQGNKILQVCLEGVNGYFVLNPEYNQNDVHIFLVNLQADYPKRAFETFNSANDAIQCIEGQIPNLKKFLTNDFKFCQKDSWTQSQINIKYKEKVIHQSGRPSRQLNSNDDDIWNSMKFNIQAKQKKHLTEITLKSNAHDVLNKYKWGNAKFHVIDASTSKPIPKATIQIYIGELQCSETNHPLFKNSETDEKGEFTFFNLVAAQHYFFTAHIIKEGFKVGCRVFEVKDSQMKESSVTEEFVALIPNFENKNSFAVTLEWNNPKIDLQLQSEFQYGQKICRVGFFNEECGYMKFNPTYKAKKYYAFQYITIEQIANYKYLFYVQRVPSRSDKEATKAFEKEQNTGSLIELANADTSFTDVQPQLKMYVNELQYPVFPTQLFDVVSLGESDKKEPNLIWEGICVDGAIGDISRIEVNKYWTRKALPDEFTRNNNEKKIFPDSEKICRKIYSME